MKFTRDYTNMIARQLRYKGNLNEFWLGMNFESEHGNVKLRTNTKSNNTFLTTKNPQINIALSKANLAARDTMAQLEEKPHYYSQLLKIKEK